MGLVKAEIYLERLDKPTGLTKISDWNNARDQIQSS